MYKCKCMCVYVCVGVCLYCYLYIWEPTQGIANRGRRHLNYVDMLIKYNCIHDKKDIRTGILNRNFWRELSNTDARVEDQQDHPRK